MSKTTHIVLSSSARMPSSCWGSYARVAVVEAEVGAEPKMISERARGVVRIIETWERLHIGKTKRCAHQRALAEAHALADELNARP